MPHSPDSPEPLPTLRAQTLPGGSWADPAQGESVSPGAETFTLLLGLDPPLASYPFCPVSQTMCGHINQGVEEPPNGLPLWERDQQLFPPGAMRGPLNQRAGNCEILLTICANVCETGMQMSNKNV